MIQLENHICGNWVTGQGEGKPLFDAVTGELIATASAKGLDIPDILAFGREKGTRALSKMTFHERGLMLKKLALHLHKHKETFYPISYRTGATRADSWIDIEGGIGNLFANASLRRNFPNSPYHVDGDPIDLSKGGKFMAHHIMVPKRGVAIHINAYNFPVWGMLEKCAVNWMAGVAAVVKPATVTSFLTEAVVRSIIESKILPEGSLQLICGSAYNLIDAVESQDVVTFTGSASTGRLLKSNPRIIEEAVPFNMEADSLNCTVLGADAIPGTPEFKLFIKEVHREMTVKCGQKCTAIRRVFVPEHLIEAVEEALAKRLEQTTIGNPTAKGVQMGAMASKDQIREVLQQVDLLKQEADLIYGDQENVDLIEANYEKGAFLSPILLRNNAPLQAHKVHEVEAFGPISTLMPYKSLDEVIDLAQRGKGSLCCSISTYDDQIASAFVLGSASHHGRILVLNRENAKQSTGHGSPLPYLVHGGPGRAGGGEEMGGLRGIKHYLQRCAIQGTPTTISKITGIYQVGAKTIEPFKHPFRYHFEELEVGMSHLTHKRTITDSDIQNFANLTWDVFYAHTDISSLKGSIFEKRAAHGYFLLAAAAGLFVSPAKGPVGANYGIDECRFIRPVYHHDTIQVRLTCKEKQEKDVREKNHPSGIVKWLVEIMDQDQELVAMATILTLVQKKNPFLPFTMDNVHQKLMDLTENHTPSWGILSPQHMVEHLQYFNDLALQAENHTFLYTGEKQEKYTHSLYNFHPMPTNYKHPLLKQVGMEPLQYPDLETAKKSLLESIEKVYAYFKSNPNAAVYNPVFGMLNEYEWELYNQKHFHHHFKQFNLI